jgi:hypothetical protein
MAKAGSHYEVVLRPADRRKLERLREARARTDERTYATVRELRDKGASLREIAEVLDVAHGTVAYWLRREQEGERS